MALIDPLAVDVYLDHQGVDLHLIWYLANSALEHGFLQGPLELDLDGLGVLAEGAVEDPLDLGRRSLHDLHRT